MLDQLKAMQSIAGLLKNKDKLASAVERIKENLGRVRAEGSSGNGAVRATVTGKLRVEKIDLDKTLAAGMHADDKTRRLAGDLIAQAVNDAMEKAQEKARDMVRKELEDLNMPELEKIISDKLGGLIG
jgi:DNA-binding protein YbaB